MDMVLKCLTEKYATFSGRARRKEFWLYFLACLIVYLILLGIDVSAGSFDGAIPTLTGFLSLALLLTSLGVTARRSHDTNRTGRWILIPFVGHIVLLVFCYLKGTAVENRFGEEPCVLRRALTLCRAHTSSEGLT